MTPSAKLQYALARKGAAQLMNDESEVTKWSNAVREAQRDEQYEDFLTSDDSLGTPWEDLKRSRS